MAPLERLRYLEGMVLKLKRELAQQGVSISSGEAESNAGDLRSEAGADSEPTPAGSLIGTRYVDSSNWEGIINDVSPPFHSYSQCTWPNSLSRSAGPRQSLIWRLTRRRISTTSCL